MPAEYAAFLASKVPVARHRGIAPVGPLNPALFGFQAAIVRWALRQGCCALFEACGLGKTLQQLEWARHIAAHTQRPVLILAPLAVAQQTVAEGARFGYDVRYCRAQADVGPGITVTNYEMVQAFTPDHFAGVVLDESSCLKCYTSATFNRLCALFAATPYKLCATATPAPNEHAELGNHAQFLGIMESGEMLTRWFINDTQQARTLRLKGHARRSFWRWVASWAVCVSMPSDLGFSDEGFMLPNLQIQEHIVPVDHTPRQQETGQLIPIGQLSATALHRVLRQTAPDRAAVVAGLITASPESWVLWCNSNYEAEALTAVIPDAVEVRGSQTPAVKERRLQAFVRGEIRVLVTKPEIAGYGLNFQHCHHMAFVGLNYSFENVHQALRRLWRFGQTRPVEAHLIVAESEGSILTTIKEKQRAYEEMQRAMNAAQREVGLVGDAPRLELATAVDEDVAEGRDWTLHLGDAVQVLARQPADSVHLTMTSIPFSNLYLYSESIHDMGNAADDGEFFRHLSFLLTELWRVTVPGRICAIHTKDLPLYASRDEVSGFRDFTGDTIRAMQAAGWVFHSRITIQTDPVQEVNRSHPHRLLYKTFREHGEAAGIGNPEYLVIFRKWAAGMRESTPVLHPEEEWPLRIWQRYANPVWTVQEVQRTNVLNAEIAREDGDEKHLAPLQLDTIERAITIWTNPGELVLDPFAGVGSSLYMARQLDRRALGVELKRSYWELAQRYLRNLDASGQQGTLFDLAEVFNG